MTQKNKVGSKDSNNITKELFQRIKSVEDKITNIENLVKEIKNEPLFSLEHQLFLGIVFSLALLKGQPQNRGWETSLTSISIKLNTSLLRFGDLMQYSVDIFKRSESSPRSFTRYRF